MGYKTYSLCHLTAQIPILQKSQREVHCLQLSTMESSNLALSVTMAILPNTIQLRLSGWEPETAMSL